MTLPGVAVTIEDGALGILPQSPANACVSMGICSSGVVGTLYAFTDQKTLQATLGYGPLVEAVALKLATAGGPQFALPLNPSATGSKSAVGHTGTGPGTVAASFAPAQAISLAVTTAGALGTAKFTYQLGTGPVSQPVLSLSGWATAGWLPGTDGWLVPGTLTTLQLANNSGTFAVGDTFVIGIDGSITAGGGNTGVGTVAAQLSQPLDTFQAIVDVASSGALGAATFNYSLDNDNTASGTITIPSGGVYPIPGTGVVLTFAGSGSPLFVVGDVYTFNTFTPGYSTTDLTNGFTSLFANPTLWGFVHVIGTPASAAGSAAVAAIVDAQMAVAQAAFRYAFGVVDCPTVGTILASGAIDAADTDAAILSAFANFVSARTAVGAGDLDIVSPLTGRIARRNVSWAASSRAAAVIPSESLGYVNRGALQSVTALHRDEQVTPALDAGRFVTARTLVGVPGYFITRSPTMALQTSDFSLIERRRVMDVACATARTALLPYINGTVRVDLSTGFILTQDATLIETKVNTALRNSLVDTSPPNASGSTVQLSRTADLLATSTEPVTVRVIPLGELAYIGLDIGFSNPAA